ncbi:hypothetical protein GOBAR_DD05951 [Gossypium barbadense]|nr:hypothetical protein GOBAR_DD05951 [Gossypium barbadense]
MSIIEHVVLFKVKDDTDQAKVNMMLNGLNGLVSLDPVVHLTAGPVFCTRSPISNFTHMLHSRYKSKEDLNSFRTPRSPSCRQGKLTLKLKENLNNEVQGEILGVIKGIKDNVSGIQQITCGENFSPARARGFSIASVAVFNGVNEMEGSEEKRRICEPTETEG